MNLQRQALEGRFVRLEPTVVGDAGEWLAAAETPETLRLFPFTFEPWDESGARAFIERLLGMPDWITYTVRDAETGAVLGSSSFIGVDAHNRGVEIGCTWLTPRARGTRVNAEMKLLMLSHAFDAGAIRVMLKTDSRNARSIAAIRKLGAVEEGTLRNHIVMPDGAYRHSVVFSITDDEWAAVRAGLEARLGSAQGKGLSDGSTSCH
jgi:RimJ/RimL family protein N-acetyltransferase